MTVLKGKKFIPLEKQMELLKLVEMAGYVHLVAVGN